MHFGTFACYPGLENIHRHKARYIYASKGYTNIVPSLYKPTLQDEYWIRSGLEVSGTISRIQMKCYFVNLSYTGIHFNILTFFFQILRLTWTHCLMTLHIIGSMVNCIVKQSSRIRKIHNKLVHCVHIFCSVVNFAHVHLGDTSSCWFSLYLFMNMKLKSHFHW